MIKPDKFTNPSNCVVYDGYVILEILSKKKQIISKKLYKSFIENLGEESDSLFVLSLDFLFLLLYHKSKHILI